MIILSGQRTPGPAHPGATRQPQHRDRPGDLESDPEGEGHPAQQTQLRLPRARDYGVSERLLRLLSSLYFLNEEILQCRSYGSLSLLKKIFGHCFKLRAAFRNRLFLKLFHLMNEHIFFMDH